MKYVIVIRKKAEILVAYPILFADALNHCDVVPEGFEAIAAGEIDMHAELVECFGKSDSLKLKPTPGDVDARHIENWLTNGESLLVMMSTAYDLPKKRKKRK